MPILLLLYPIIRAVIQIVTGVAVATIVYSFLQTVIVPFTDMLSEKIQSQVDGFLSVQGAAYEAVLYLDFSQCVSIFLACSSACISVKLVSVAIRAFGINTG